jgi:hypothetical protein
MCKESNESNEYKADKTSFEVMELMLLSNVFNALLLYSYLHTPLEANKVSCKKWQLVSAICNEGDGLIFFWNDIYELMITHFCHDCFSLAGTDLMVTI